MANEEKNLKQNDEIPNEDVPKNSSGSPHNSPTSQNTNTSRPGVTSNVVHEKSPSKAVEINISPSSCKGKKKVESTGSTSDTILRKRKKPEYDSPKGAPACHICSKEFVSWPAVFGHMRCHKDRPWRGAFPPPVWSENVNRDVVAEQATAALVQVAKAAQLVMKNQSGGSSKKVAGERRENDKKEADQEDAGTSEGEPKKRFVVDFDLNLPLPENDDDDVGGGGAAAV